MQFLAFPIDPGKLRQFAAFFVARFRIIERNSFIYAGVPMYDVEERCLWWWEPRGTRESLTDAEQRVAELKNAKTIPWRVVKEYDQ